MKSFIKGIFSETVPGGATGSPSLARVGTMMSLIASISWVSYLVTKNHAIPDLTGIIALNSSLYALNRASAFFGKDGK